MRPERGKAVAFLIEQLPDKDLAVSFFLMFSRFEYALKRAGYLKPNAHYASADWGRFAREHESQFQRLAKPDELLEAVQYLRTRPPKKQIVVNGQISWDDGPVTSCAEGSLQWLLVMVRRVRNNLFHGGKYPYAPINEPLRDVKLLEHCITVLEASLNLSPEIHEYFYQ